MSSTLLLRLAACTFSLLAMAATVAAQSATKHARVELLSQQGSITPGANLQLGVHFTLEPGWHIYWINPGDSGQPPDFKWQLPAKFTAGEIQWPRPERMQSNKELADYGYHNEVLLPVTLHVPAGFVAHTSEEIGVEARWLVCREVCIPEHAQLRLALPAGAQAKQNAAAVKLFAETEKLLPKPLPRGWKTSVISAKDNFILTISAGHKLAKAEFFPLEPGQIDNPAPQEVQSSPTGVKLTLRKSELLTKPVSILHGVLVIPGSPAYKIEAPVRQPIQ